MIQLGYNFLKKDLNKIRKFKNPTIILDKNRIKKNSNYKIFLNKKQYNNLIENGNLRYRLTDSRKRMHVQNGDGLSSLFQMALPFVKSIAPKVLTTLGLAGLSTGVSHGINKALKKDHVIKISDKQLEDINKNLDKINNANIFDKKITLNQRGSGIFSFLLPLIPSTVIPSLISKGSGNFFLNK